MNYLPTSRYYLRILSFSNGVVWKFKYKKQKDNMSLLPENILKELVKDDFCGLPRLKQIEGFLSCLCKAGHTKVTPQEISQLFKDANMDLPQRKKKIRCGAFKVREYFDLMLTKDNVQNPTVCITKIAEDLYKISLSV